MALQNDECSSGSQGENSGTVAAIPKYTPPRSLRLQLSEAVVIRSSPQRAQVAEDIQNTEEFYQVQVDVKSPDQPLVDSNEHLYDLSNSSMSEPSTPIQVPAGSVMEKLLEVQTAIGKPLEDTKPGLQNRPDPWVGGLSARIYVPAESISLSGAPVTQTAQGPAISMQSRLFQQSGLGT